MWCNPHWWFVSDSVTDIGLPDGYTRDKILNTNNYADAFIKTFKSTMLGMRRNKRVDTLVIIIADIMLPYYRIWRDSRVKHAKDHIEVTHEGYKYWESNSKKHLGGQQYHVDVVGR